MSSDAVPPLQMPAGTAFAATAATVDDSGSNERLYVSRGTAAGSGLVA